MALQTIPGRILDLFLKRVAGPLLGLAERAAEYLRLARLIDVPEELENAVASAQREAAQLSGRVADRWTWLAWYLSRFVYDRDA